MNKLSELILDLKKYLLIKLGLNFTNKQEKELVHKIKLAAHEFDFTNL